MHCEKECICERINRAEQRTLDAAREAVDRLPAYGRVAGALAVGKLKALAAIDALREAR
jgi:hypothetical protein